MSEVNPLSKEYSIYIETTAIDEIVNLLSKKGVLNWALSGVSSSWRGKFSAMFQTLPTYLS